MSSEHPEERRSVRRSDLQREALLKASPSLLDSAASTGDVGNSLTFIGHTLNISEGGLALVVPSVPVDERILDRGNYTLDIVLDLPAGALELQAVPVHLTPISKRDPGRGYLIGTRIATADGAARRRLSEYLRRDLSDS